MTIAALQPETDAAPAVRLLPAGERLACPDADLEDMACFPAFDPWTRFVSEVYRFPVYRFVAQEHGRLAGLLVLVHIRHLLFGNYLATAPFASYGGFAYVSTRTRDALLAQARALASDLKVDYVNVRFADGQSVPPAGWTQHPIYSTYRAGLSPDTEAMLSAYSSDHRNHIRKALRRGFTVRFGGTELLDQAYEALARSMHELGSPYHSRTYLRGMAGSLGPALEFAVVHSPEGHLAGAGVFILQRGVVTNLHANILRAFRPDYAGEFLYWSVIARYAAKGCAVFDIGRSLNGSGNETFKMKWKPRKQPLAYWYALREGAAVPELNQKNPRFRMAIRAWQALPGFVVRPAGPFLISGLA